jgi:hypothetical protein
MAAVIIPMRLRTSHTPFSIDLSPPTRLMPQEAVERQAQSSTGQGGVATAIYVTV